jgi:hypothetical protein
MRVVPAHLGHHASPRHDICVDLLTRFLLMRSNGLEETVKVFGLGIIVLDERVEAFGEICAETWSVIVLEGGVVKSKFMLCIIRKTCELL